MSTVRISLLGFYGLYQPQGIDLFEFLTLPEGYDKETFINTLFLDYGDKGVLYTNPDMFRRMMGAWSSKWAVELARLYKTLTDDYEPLWNIDCYEKVQDKENENASGRTTATSSETDANTTENTVSAYNSSSYEPHDKSQYNGTIGQTASGTSADERHKGLSHDGHYYGNGGVTMSQQMAEAEIKLREKYNLYHEACKLFSQDLLLYIY